MTSTARDIPDVTEMSAVHRVFRQSFASAPRLISGVADRDVDRAGVVGSYYRNILEFLLVHHSSEDELIFPRLIERSGATGLVSELEQQHLAVDTAAAQATDALIQWTATAATSDGLAFAEQWAALGDVLTAHMDIEEEAALPLIEQHITVAEWEEMPGHAMSSFKGDNLFLILGLVREQMTQEQRDRMLEGMPPPAADAWRNVGIDAYKQTVAELMGAMN